MKGSCCGKPLRTLYSNTREFARQCTGGCGQVYTQRKRLAGPPRAQLTHDEAALVRSVGPSLLKALDAGTLNFDKIQPGLNQAARSLVAKAVRQKGRLS